MITPLDNDLPPVPGTEPESTEAGRFTRLRADLRRAAREVDWTEVRAFALAAAPIALIVVLAGLLVLLLASLGGRLHDAARAVVDHPVVHVVVDPITTFFSAYRGPVAPTTLAAVWGIGALVLLIASLLGAWGARVGWVVVGAASVAMAWIGAPTAGNAAVGAAMTALAWSLATILAGTGRRYTCGG
uniref:hypothetical protein n=1 Tax=Saccharothrix espanaensis TaxID=103731 RepID=UPI003F49A971